MEVRYHMTGAARKELVTAVSEITGWAAVYQKAPTFAYVVNNYTIDKNGTLVLDGRVDAKDARALLAALAEREFVTEDTLESDYAPAMEISGFDTPTRDDSDDGGPDRLCIEMPLDGFTETALANLEKLVASKAALIRKAVGADDLAIERRNDRLCFPWFTLGSSQGEVHAYTQFVAALCEMAKKQRRVTAKEKPADSEKFAFRCFLLRLGFIGAEYAAARKVLLANLPGDSSFKNGKRGDQGEAPVAAYAADSGAEHDSESHADPCETEADSAENGREADDSAPYPLEEALADAELIYEVNQMEASL